MKVNWKSKNLWGIVIITVLLVTSIIGIGSSRAQGKELDIQTAEVSELKKKNKENKSLIKENESLIKEKDSKIAELEEKVKEAEPWYEMEEDERQRKIKEEKEKKEAEEAAAAAAEEKKKAEEKAKKEAEEKAQAEKEAEEKRKAEEEAKKGYDTGITYDQLARNPDDYIDEKVKFNGKVIQVIEGDYTTQIRFAVNDDYDKVIYAEYISSILDSRILEDDVITIMGTSSGLLSYESTLGATITIPSVYVDKIEQ